MSKNIWLIPVTNTISTFLLVFVYPYIFMITLYFFGHRGTGIQIAEILILTYPISCVIGWIGGYKKILPSAYLVIGHMLLLFVMFDWLHFGFIAKVVRSVSVL